MIKGILETPNDGWYIHDEYDNFYAITEDEAHAILDARDSKTDDEWRIYETNLMEGRTPSDIQLDLDELRNDTSDSYDYDDYDDDSTDYDYTFPIKIILVEPEKKPVVKVIDNDIQTIKKTVGGTPELARFFNDGIAIVCNDMGKRIGLPKNRVLVDINGDVFDHIAGSFFICQIKNDYLSIPDELIDKYLDKITDEFVFTDALKKY